MRSPQACLNKSACEETVPYRSQLELYSYMNKLMNTPETQHDWFAANKGEERTRRVVSRNHTRGTWRVRQRSGASSANTRSCERAISHAHIYTGYRMRRDTQDNNRGNDLECRKILLEGRGDQQTHSRSTGGISSTALQLPRQKVGTSPCWIRSWNWSTLLWWQRD